MGADAAKHSRPGVRGHARTIVAITSAGNIADLDRAGVYYRRAGAGAGGLMSGVNDLKMPSLSDFRNGGWGSDGGWARSPSVAKRPTGCRIGCRSQPHQFLASERPRASRGRWRRAGNGDAGARLIPDFAPLLRSPADPATTARGAPTIGRPLGRRNGLQGSRVGAVALSHPANPEQSRERTVGPSGSRTAGDLSELERSIS